MKKKTTQKQAKKPVKKKASQDSAPRGPKPYKRAVELVVKMAEDFVDFGDCTDDLLDEIAAAKKRLEPREQEVISRLAAVASNGGRYIEIDEASPGSELQYKV